MSAISPESIHPDHREEGQGWEVTKPANLKPGQRKTHYDGLGWLELQMSKNKQSDDDQSFT